MPYETSYDEIRSDVAFLRGWGRSSSGWDTEKTQALAQIIKSGLQRFLFGALIPGSAKAYEWAFLRQSFRFGTVIGQRDYDLPPDFGTPEAWVYFASGTAAYCPIPVVNQAMFDRNVSIEPTASGLPRMATISPVRSVMNAAQAWKVSLHPLPDAVYDLSMPYRINPAEIGAAQQYLPGGPVYARAIKLAIMAEAANVLDNARQHEEDYQAALVAAMSHDASLKGSNLGYDGDKSSEVEAVDIKPVNFWVTVNGVRY